MKTQQGIEREAEEGLRRHYGSVMVGADEAIKYLSAAGLLATPTMIECAEACVGYDEKYGHMTSLTDAGQRVANAGRAHAATLAKPERYDSGPAAGSAVHGWGFSTVERIGNGYSVVIAHFAGPDAERHAREHAAKLNAAEAQ